MVKSKNHSPQAESSNKQVYISRPCPLNTTALCQNLFTESNKKKKSRLSLPITELTSSFLRKSTAKQRLHQRSELECYTLLVKHTNTNYDQSSPINIKASYFIMTKSAEIRIVFHVAHVYNFAGDTCFSPVCHLCGGFQQPPAQRGMFNKAEQH